MKKKTRREKIIKSLMKEIETYRPLDDPSGAVPGDIANTILMILWNYKWSWQEDDKIWQED